MLMNKDLHEDGVDGEYGERDFDHNLHWKYLFRKWPRNSQFKEKFL